MYLDSWERKDKYTTEDSDTAAELCDKIFGRVFKNRDDSHEWCLYMKDKNLMTGRQWSDIPGCCAALELIQEHPMEWVRTEWCRRYVMQRLTA